MFRSIQHNHRESIRLGADGFCFFLPDGTERVVLEGPVTAVPLTMADEAERECCYRTVFEEMRDCKVFADRIEGLDMLLLCGVAEGTARLIETEHAEAVVTCRLHDLIAGLAGRECGTLAAKVLDKRVDIVAVRGGRLLYLNCVARDDDFRIEYYIVKVWKEFGFKGSSDRLQMSGLDDKGILNNIGLMTGVEVECGL